MQFFSQLERLFRGTAPFLDLCGFGMLGGPRDSCVFFMSGVVYRGTVTFLDLFCVGGYRC